MSLEFWSTIASVGTFLVITATAIAAVLQLRHMQAANKIAYIYQFFHEYDGPELRDAFSFVRHELAARLEDPAFRRELREGVTDRRKHPEVIIGNFFDQWGLNYRDGAIDRDSFMRMNAAIVLANWNRLAPVVALLADTDAGNTSFQQFEYLAVKAREWLEHHPQGDYPKGAPRIPLVDPWAETDGIVSAVTKNEANRGQAAN